MAKESLRMLIKNAHLFGVAKDWNPGWLVVEGAKINLMGGGTPPDFPSGTFERILDARGSILLPGFIDIHVHGAMGQEAMDATPDALRKMAQFYAQHGVTGFLPSTWTAIGEATHKVIDVVKRMMGRVEKGASILGVHLEGPYLNPSRCGAQDVNLIRPAEEKELARFFDSDIVKLFALAPEFPENMSIIQECVRRGIVASVGHSAATYDQVGAAVKLGLRHATHTFNAMTAFGHRELGTVGAVMAYDEITCELICDNIHVHPGAQKILVDVKTPNGVVLVTDAIRGAGLPDGEHPIDNRVITVKDGVARLPDGTIAGSILTMERALKNVMAATGRPLHEIWQMSSLNSARQIGISAHKGSLEVDKDADLVLLDTDFNVKLTVVEGEIVFEA
ncbi:MAG: N-acetylglucosamine-6-phosphate deacetylase [Chloroflexota bacterium]